MTKKILVGTQNSRDARSPRAVFCRDLSSKIPQSILAELASFIGASDRVTSRKAWQEKVTNQSLQIARLTCPEVGFFSTWDFRLPSEDRGDWQLIEFNDNGSGLLLYQVLNDV